MARRRARVLGLSLCTLVWLAGCSCGSTPGEVLDTGPGVDAGPVRDTGPRPDATGDGGPRIDAGPMRCPNFMVEGTEECDDGNATADDGCSPTCMLECGDGAVTGDELCDTAIASGSAGECPTGCDDADACTTDTLAGAACAAECVHGVISAPMGGDGCCPPGADATSDSDCTTICGNGIVETGETCDTTIVGGMPGACPASCDDGIACTADSTTGAACTIACVNAAITTPVGGDGCCPTGATSATDADCAGCGDGTVMPPETCDTAIAASCPTTCSDAMTCTTDSLVAGGTCMAACSFTAVTAPMAGDGCCPPGATIGTDTDCGVRCGDGIITAPETCEDGNTSSGDGCSSTCVLEATATAFRFQTLVLRDPHVFADIRMPFPLGCTDVTNGPLGMGINQQIRDNIAMDGDGDGDLDLSLANVFRPLEQRAGMSTPSDLVFPDCTEPESSTMCALAAGAMHTVATTTSMGGTSVCLPLLAGTTRAAYGAFNVPTSSAGSNCYVASVGTVVFTLGGIPITLQDAQIGGEWVGAPATQIRDGLIRGFMTEADADAAVIPPGTTGMASIDGQPLSRLLRGGVMNCSQPSPMAGDTDTYMGMRGWYFYLSFTARSVPYTEL